MTSRRCDWTAASAASVRSVSDSVVPASAGSCGESTSARPDGCSPCRTRMDLSIWPRISSRRSRAVAVSTGVLLSRQGRSEAPWRGAAPGIASRPSDQRGRVPGQWLDQRGTVVLDVVHVGADRVGRQPAGRGGRQQRVHVRRLGIGRVEPVIPPGRVDDHRHPLVDVAHLVLRPGRDDHGGPEPGLGVVFGRGLVPPQLVQPGEGEDTVVGTVDVVRLLADLALVLHLEPFVEPVGRQQAPALGEGTDRKSTRLNSSHTVISYAVFCLKKKTREWLGYAGENRRTTYQLGRG